MIHLRTIPGSKSAGGLALNPVVDGAVAGHEIVAEDDRRRCRASCGVGKPGISRRMAAPEGMSVEIVVGVFPPDAKSAARSKFSRSIR